MWGCGETVCRHTVRFEIWCRNIFKKEKENQLWHRATYFAKNV